jgi:solute carrier family 13 (sodium-dependent dicarboxylate transporter), member 2/3/5
MPRKEQSASLTTGTENPGDQPASDSQNKRWAGMAGGLLLFAVIAISDPPEGLSTEGWYTAAAAVLMATWWIFEAIPIPVTALIPLALFPFLGISDIAVTASSYANPIIFLFMGGFIIAIAMQEWGLHRRIAYNIISVIGSNPRSIIFGFMVSAAFMSMWVSNTAAAMMMLPIAISIIEITKNGGDIRDMKDHYANFAIALMLAIAYAANIGGLGTIIGTPTNALMVGFVNEAYNIEITFLQWMAVGMPLVIIGLPVIYFSLVNISFPVRFGSLPGGREYIDREVDKLGSISRPELMVAFIFALVAVSWITRPLLVSYIPGISDAGIAIFGVVLLFVCPVNIRTGRFLLSWKSASMLPWGILLLFGGGLTLASAIQRTGLAGWIGGHLTIMNALPLVFVILVVTGVVIFLTELTSNTATAAAFLPVMGTLAIGMDQDPLMFTIPAALSASCAFMLPVATPPNAIVYGSGIMSISHMLKAGMLLNLFFILMITIFSRYFIHLLLAV